MSGHVSVAILERDAELRHRLRAWLEQADGITVVGEAQDELEARRLISSQCPRILLADLTAAGGAEGIARIAALFPETRILVLHGREEQKDAVLEALRRGAWGHLEKEAMGPEEVAEAVRTVAQGAAYLSPTVAGWMVDEVARRGQKPDADGRGDHRRTTKDTKGTKGT